MDFDLCYLFSIKELPQRNTKKRKKTKLNGQLLKNNIYQKPIWPKTLVSSTKGFLWIQKLYLCK